MADDLELERNRREVLREILEDQFSLVESLKEALGVRTKLTEFENSQLKNARAITKLLASQDIGLTSLAEKKKQIAKNAEVIEKITISQAAIENGAINAAKEAGKQLKEKTESLNEQLQAQFESQHLSDEELIRQAESINLEKEAAELAQNRLDLILASMTSHEQAAYYEELSLENLKKANEERIKEKETLENIQKSMGKTGAILAGISKIPILGGLIDSKKIIEELEKSADKTGEKFVGIKKIFTAIGNEASRSMKDPAVAFGVGSKITKGLFDDIKSVVMMLDEFNGKLTKNFGISQKQAQDLNKEFLETKRTADSEFVTVSGISDAFIALNSKAGTFAEFSKETLNTFAKLNKQAGISTEALTELNDLTYLNQGTLKDTTKEFTGQLALLSGQTGQALNLKQLQEDIKNVSAAVKLNFGGSATAIAEAVFKAKALGLELKDLESISSSLLNFQSSIEDELSAELLTGKQLNLEGARYAALIGDQAMLAEELANNIGSAEEFTGMTVITQDALAKSLGMNRNQLAETLIQQERLNSLNAEGNTLQERYNNLKAAGNSEEQIAQMLGDEQLAQQLESAGLQEKFNVLVENLKEEFLPVAMEILPGIMKTLTFMGKNMDKLINLAIVFKVAQLGAAVASLAVAAAVKGPWAVALGVAAAIAGGIALKYAVGDAIFPAGGRAILSPREGGLIPISNNDDIVVAPQLMSTVMGKQKPNENKNTVSQQANKVAPQVTVLTLDKQKPNENKNIVSQQVNKIVPQLMSTVAGKQKPNENKNIVSQQVNKIAPQLMSTVIGKQKPGKDKSIMGQLLNTAVNNQKLNNNTNLTEFSDNTIQSSETSHSTINTPQPLSTLIESRKTPEITTRHSKDTNQIVENKVNITPSNTLVSINLDGGKIGNANIRQDYSIGKYANSLGGKTDFSV